MTIKVIKYSVNVSEKEVSHEICEYDNWEQLIDELKEEYDEDVYCTPIEDLDEGDRIVVEDDVSFLECKLLTDEDDE